MKLKIAQNTHMIRLFSKGVLRVPQKRGKKEATLSFLIGSLARFKALCLSVSLDRHSNTVA